MEPFVPYLVVGASNPDGGFSFVKVDLFVVHRGVTGPNGAAVSIVHEGDRFYIPRPNFGSRTEARSLQTLDLVVQTLRAATTRESLPKLQTLGVVATK